MNAEALLGPLSAIGSDQLWSYHIRKIQSSYEVVFTNGELMTQNDPRLGPLPPGWKKQYWTEAKRQHYDDECDSTLKRLKF